MEKIIMNEFLHGFTIAKVAGNMYFLIIALILFDVISGLLASAKERKLNSSINFSGLVKKVGELVALAFITLLDAYFQTNGNLTKLGVTMLVVYEGMSIVENFDRIGVNLSFLTKYFDPSKIKGGNK